MTGTDCLRVCVTCRRERETEASEEERDGARLLRALDCHADELSRAGMRVEEVRCLSGCKRACTAVLSGPGKWSYVLCEIDPEQGAADLADYALSYAGAADGQVPWRERPESLRRRTLARIPPLESAKTSRREEAA